MDEAAAIELGFFKALAAHGISLKVAAQLYDDTVEGLVKSAAVRYPRATELNPRAYHPESGMLDVLGKPEFSDLVQASRTVPRHTGRVGAIPRNPATGMEDSLRPDPWTTRMQGQLRSQVQRAITAVQKNPVKAGPAATAMGTVGAAGAGTGVGLLGGGVLNSLRSNNSQ